MRTLISILLLVALFVVEFVTAFLLILGSGWGAVTFFVSAAIFVAIDERRKSKVEEA